MPTRVLGWTAGRHAGLPALFAEGLTARVHTCIDGAQSRDGRIAGAYVHGLFANDALRAALLRDLGAAASTLHFEQSIDETLDALAAHCAAHLDLDALWEMAR